jgi:hypothetical protein
LGNNNSNNNFNFNLYYNRWRKRMNNNNNKLITQLYKKTTTKIAAWNSCSCSQVYTKHLTVCAYVTSSKRPLDGLSHFQPRLTHYYPLAIKPDRSVRPLTSGEAHSGLGYEFWMAQIREWKAWLSFRTVLLHLDCLSVRPVAGIIHFFTAYISANYCQTYSTYPIWNFLQCANIWSFGMLNVPVASDTRGLTREAWFGNVLRNRFHDTGCSFGYSSWN